MPCHTGNVPLRVWILWKKNLLVEQLHIQIRLDLPEEFRLGKPECRVGCVCVPPHTERRGNWETTQFSWRNSLNVYISPDTFTFHLLGFYIFSAWEHGCGFFSRAEFSFIVMFTERAQGEAEWDGEDGDGSGERHQQAPTQHSLHWGKPTAWLITNELPVVMSHECHNT